MKSITPENLHKLLQSEDGKFLVVDVRTEEQHKTCTIKGARNIHVDSIEQFKDEFAKYDNVFFHCGGGGKSSRATRTMEDAGLENVVNIEGGLKAWKAAGFDVESKNNDDV